MNWNESCFKALKKTQCDGQIYESNIQRGLIISLCYINLLDLFLLLVAFLCWYTFLFHFQALSVCFCVHLYYRERFFIYVFSPLLSYIPPLLLSTIPPPPPLLSISFFLILFYLLLFSSSPFSFSLSLFSLSHSPHLHSSFLFTLTSSEPAHPYKHTCHVSKPIYFYTVSVATFFCWFQQ